MVRRGLFKTLAIGKSQYGKVIGLNSKHGKDRWLLSPESRVRGSVNEK